MVLEDRLRSGKLYFKWKPLREKQKVRGNDAGMAAYGTAAIVVAVAYRLVT